jgi:hypothetical protein
VRIALERGAFGAGSVAHVLESRRRAQGLPPPVRVDLPADPRVRDLRVIPHRLEDYDQLSSSADQEPAPVASRTEGGGPDGSEH